MEIKINNEDYKNLELEYSKVKIRGIEYRVEECNGKLNIVKISDGSECVMNLTMTQHTNSILIN
jgi:hypothetical protein